MDNSICLKCGSLINHHFPVHWCLYVGRHIYYYHYRNGDTYPGIIVDISDDRGCKKPIKITYNGLKRDVTVWVSENSLTTEN